MWSIGGRRASGGKQRAERAVIGTVTVVVVVIVVIMGMGMGILVGVAVAMAPMIVACVAMVSKTRHSNQVDGQP